MLLAFVATPHPARATIVLALDLAELTWRSDRIVVGDVVSVRPAWDARHERIDSTVEIAVVESWKGAAAGGERLVVVQPGGVVDGIAMRVVGMPRFVPGERAVVFLRGAPGGPSAVVGLAQGKRTLRRDPATGVFIAEGGAGGATTLAPDASGRLRPAAADPDRPLAELRAIVRDLVRR